MRRDSARKRIKIDKEKNENFVSRLLSSISAIRLAIYFRAKQKYHSRSELSGQIMSNWKQIPNFCHSREIDQYCILAPERKQSET